ncbi:MAG: anti-sigma factor [Pseudomonadota bacterium]
MDNLAKQLRKDADAINAEVSPQLDSRIRASLEAVTQERPATPAPARETARSPGFWWASSLTGIAAALVLIVVVNTNTVETTDSTVASNDEPVLQLPDLPRLPLNVEAAMTTSLLEQELENFQSDLQRAAKAVEDDVERIIDRGEPEPAETVQPEAAPTP